MSEKAGYVSDPEVQWTLARRVLLHWILLYVCLIAVSAVLQVMLGNSGVSPGAAAASAIDAQIPLLCMMIALVPIFLRDVLKTSNRFVGPMTRLRKQLANSTQGHTIDSIRFRDNDFWHGTASDFNQLLDRHESLKERCEMLEQRLAEIGDATLQSDDVEKNGELQEANLP